MNKKRIRRYTIRSLWLVCAAIIILALILRYAVKITFPLWATAAVLSAVFTLIAAALICQIVFDRSKEEPRGIFTAKIIAVSICWAAAIYNIIKITLQLQ